MSRAKLRLFILASSPVLSERGQIHMKVCGRDAGGSKCQCSRSDRRNNVHDEVELVGETQQHERTRDTHVPPTVPASLQARAAH